MVLLHSLLSRPVSAFTLAFWLARALPEHLGIVFALALVWAVGTECLLARSGVVMPQPLAPLFGLLAALWLQPASNVSVVNVSEFRQVQGAVTGDVRLSSSGWPTVELDLEWVGTSEWRHQSRGRLRLLIRGGTWESVPPPGAKVFARGTFQKDRGYFEVPSRALEVVSPAPEWQMRRREIHLAVRAALSRLRGKSGPLATALVLGRGDELTQEERQVFREAGASPLLALSGLHLGVLALLLNLIFRHGPLRGLSEFLVAAVLVTFVVVVGPLPSLVRALVFWVCLHAASWLRWEVDPLEVTAAGALALLGVFPEWATHPSFLLSVSAMAGILTLSGDYRDFFVPWFGERVAGWLSGGWAAASGTGAVSLLMFGAFYPQAVLSNLIGMIPLMGLLWGTLLYLALSFLPAPALLVHGAGWCLEQLTEGLFLVMGGLALPGAFSGWLGWLAWGVGLVPVVFLLYKYGRYGYLVRFPAGHQGPPRFEQPGRTKALGSELSDQPRTEAAAG